MEPSLSLAQRLARRLPAVEAARKCDGDAQSHEIVRVCEKLRHSLTRLAGAEGFASLLRRALALAGANAPAVKSVKLSPDGSLEGLEALAADDDRDGTEAASSILAQLLGLLMTFIGEPLTLRVVREIWPEASFDE